MSLEVDVTYLFDLDCSEFSASRFERGENVGHETWAAANEQAEEKPLVTSEQQDDLRKWIKDFGAWDDQEIAAMSEVETNALLIQFVAGEIRELEGLDLVDDDEARNEASEQGRIGSHLYKDDNGRWFFYVGS
jgi:hypothetical protein